MEPGNFPRVELTNPNSNNSKTVYGYVKNVYFGPTFGQTTTYLPSKLSAINREQIRKGPYYEFSNENVNSVSKKRKWFFTPNNYTQKKYGIYPKHGYAFYESIPILRLSRDEAETLAIDTRSVVFCQPDFEDINSPSPKGTLFEVVWMDKLVKSSDVQHRSVTKSMFDHYVAMVQQFTKTKNYTRDATSSIIDLSQVIDPSKNLIQNLLRLSIDTSRTTGIRNQLGGKRRSSRRSKGTRRGKKRVSRTRKN